MLDVLSDGYSLPFTSLPQRAFFQNHHSVAENEELLVSGAIAEVSREELSVCNPLGVVRNSAGQGSLDHEFALC